MKVTISEGGVPSYWGTNGRALGMLITAVATTDFLLFGYGMLQTGGTMMAHRLTLF